jgi:signal peptidase I
MLKLLIELAIFPFLVIFNQLTALVKKRLSWILVIKKVFIIILIVIFVLPTWVIGYVAIGKVVGQKLGLVNVAVPVAGTGSMYPTFPRGESKTPKEQGREIVSRPGMKPYPNGLQIWGKRFFGHILERGDIVVVENDQIHAINQAVYGEGSGWVKRIVGLPGDTLEIREGLVYLNGEAQKEPYTALPHSTFAESFLAECTEVTVPKDSIFVMGDNRKASGDSREIGFITIDSIRFVLPFKDQFGAYDQNWRDTSIDLDQDSKIKLNTKEYLQLLNQQRLAFGAKPLKLEPRLVSSATKRAQTMLQYDDFSFEATKSGYTMSRAMNDSGYSNIVWGEAPVQGYFEASEILENQFEFPASKEFLLNPEYDDVGLAAIEGEINNCPTQIIVQHFGGYVPPNYSIEVINSWKQALKNLQEIQSGWQKLKTYEQFYEDNKEGVDRINAIISERIANIAGIVERMEENLWLTSEQQSYADQDESLYNEQQELAEYLNSR